MVEGLGDLHLEEGLRMSPDDMAGLGVEPGGTVTVSQDGFALALEAFDRAIDAFARVGRKRGVIS